MVKTTADVTYWRLEWWYDVERRCEFEACAVGTGCLGWFLQVESSRALLIGRRHPPDFNFTTKLTDRVVLIEGRAPLPPPQYAAAKLWHYPAITGSVAIT
jgi:hypothetical protein